MVGQSTNGKGMREAEAGLLLKRRRLHAPTSYSPASGSTIQGQRARWFASLHINFLAITQNATVTLSVSFS